MPTSLQTSLRSIVPSKTPASPFLSPFTAAGRAALDALVTQQAQIIAYIDDYKMLLIATLALFALLVIFKKASGSPGQQPSWRVDCIECTIPSN